MIRYHYCFVCIALAWFFENKQLKVCAHTGPAIMVGLSGLSLGATALEEHVPQVRG